MVNAAGKPPVGHHPKHRLQFGLATLLTLPLYLAGFCAIAAALGLPAAILALSVPLVILARRCGEPVLATSFLLIVVSMLAALILPPALREPGSRRDTCIYNLTCIGRAILQYEAANGCLPPPCTLDQNGQSLASWRTMILPYLEGNDVYTRYRLDQPWNGPNNRKLAHLNLGTFRCPGDAELSCGCTSYLAVVGPGTAWSTGESIRLKDIDDPSRTILLVEMAGSDVALLEPRDLTLDEALREVHRAGGRGISSGHPGVSVLFADGHTAILDESTSREVLHDLLTFERKQPARADGQGGGRQ